MEQNLKSRDRTAQIYSLIFDKEIKTVLCRKDYLSKEWLLEKLEIHMFIKGTST